MEYLNILDIPNIYNLPRQVSNLKQNYRDMVLPAIAIYIDIISVFFRDAAMGQSSNLRRFRKRFSSILFDVTRPKTRTSKGALELLELIDNLLGKLRNTLDVAGSSLSSNISERSSSAGSPRRSGKSAASKKSFKFRKYFAELFDSDTPKIVGFDYLTTDEEEAENNEGLRTMTIAAFGNRLNLEMEKYYSESESDIIVNIGGESLSLNTNIDSTPIHFAPSLVRVGDSNLPLTKQGVDLWDRDSNDLVANRIISYKQTGRLSNSKFSTNNASKLNAKQQEKSYYTDSVVNKYGVTIEPVVKGTRTAVTSLADDAFGINLQKAQSRTENLEKITNPQEVAQEGSINVVSKVTSKFSLGATLIGNDNAAKKVEREDKLSLDRLNPTTKKNIFSNKLNNRNNSEIISKMPLQLKSIVAASAGSNKVKNNWSQLSKDPFVDYRTANSFIFNYLQLQTVEMLTGYQLVEEADGVLIKQPIFETATLTKMREAGSREIFCRMKKFEDQDIPSSDGDEGLELPLYDSYFIVLNNQIEELEALAFEAETRVVDTSISQEALSEAATTVENLVLSDLLRMGN